MEQPKKESINIMNCSISSIYYCPVKTLSFQSIESCNVKKELGMINAITDKYINEKKII